MLKSTPKTLPLHGESYRNDMAMISGLMPPSGAHTENYSNLNCCKTAPKGALDEGKHLGHG